MSIKLYELSQNYKNLEQLLDNDDIPTELIEKALNDVTDNINIKAENICKVLKNMSGDIATLKEEEKRLSTMRKGIENKYKSLFGYLENTLKVVMINTGD